MFSDGYANAAIGPTNTMLGKLYPATMKSHQNKELVGAMGFAGELCLAQRCLRPELSAPVI